MAVREDIASPEEPEPLVRMVSNMWVSRLGRCLSEVTLKRAALRVRNLLPNGSRDLRTALSPIKKTDICGAMSKAVSKTAHTPYKRINSPAAL